MKKTKELTLCSIVLVAFGCGSNNNGGGDTATPSQDFIDNMPNSSQAGLDEEDGDITSAKAAIRIDESSEALLEPGCHPHVFLRQREVINFINRYVVKKFFAGWEDLIDNHARTASNSGVTWVKTNAGVTYRVTFSKGGAGQYSLTVDAKPASAADSAYQTILTSTVTAGTQPHTGNGTAHMDFSKLHQVIPTETTVGVIDLSYIVNANNKKVVVTFTGFTTNDTNPHTPPGNANFVFARTKNVGGSLKVNDSFIFACPKVTGGDGGQVFNTTQVANVSMTHRWQRRAGADGGPTVFDGRSDAKATGGNIGSNVVYAVTCGDHTSTGADANKERYWSMGMWTNSSQSNLVAGWYDSGSFGVSTCDTAFGTLPSGPPTYITGYEATLNSTNFGNADVVAFPGMPTPFP